MRHDGRRPPDLDIADAAQVIEMAAEIAVSRASQAFEARDIEDLQQPGRAPPALPQASTPSGIAVTINSVRPAGAIR
jgi:hypothetical protein